MGMAAAHSVPAIAAWLEKVSEGVDLYEARSIADVVRRRSGACRRSVFYYFNADAVGLAVALLRLRRLGEAVYQELEIVHDESFGGIVTAGLVTTFGGRTRLLRRRYSADRAVDMLGLLRSTWSLAIAVDGRGPYGIVGEPFASFVRRSGAAAIPVAASISRGWRLPVRAPIRVPSRRGAIALSIGEPIDHGASSATLAERLGEAKASADRLLSV